MTRLFAPVLCAALVACNMTTAAQSQVCVPAGTLVRLPGVPEASGAVTGRRSPGILWTHNDSGTAELFAFDTTGAGRGRVPLANVRITDWEDLSIGPCPGGSCIYAADIGDNERARPSITIYRLLEPRPNDPGVTVRDAWHATYPDRPQDAESLFVTPSGEVYLVTKESGQSASLFRVPQPGNGPPPMLQRVTSIPIRLATGAAISADGTWTAIRSNELLLLYRTRDLLGGRGEPAHRVDLAPLGEPQGEGVAFGAGGMVYLTGEAGGGGTLATLRCNLR